MVRTTIDAVKEVVNFFNDEVRVKDREVDEIEILGDNLEALSALRNYFKLHKSLFPNHTPICRIIKRINLNGENVYELNVSFDRTY